MIQDHSAIGGPCAGPARAASVAAPEREVRWQRPLARARYLERRALGNRVQHRRGLWGGRIHPIATEASMTNGVVIVGPLRWRNAPRDPKVWCSIAGRLAAPYHAGPRTLRWLWAPPACWTSSWISPATRFGRSTGSGSPRPSTCLPCQKNAMVTIELAGAGPALLQIGVLGSPCRSHPTVSGFAPGMTRRRLAPPVRRLRRVRPVAGLPAPIARRRRPLPHRP
jgi:hypothetical protein